MPPVVFELLQISFWRWAGFDPTKVESCNSNLNVFIIFKNTIKTLNNPRFWSFLLDTTRNEVVSKNRDLTKIVSTISAYKPPWLDRLQLINERGNFFPSEIWTMAPCNWKPVSYKWAKPTPFCPPFFIFVRSWPLLRVRLFTHTWLLWMDVTI